MTTSNVVFGSLTAKQLQNVPLWDYDKNEIINLDEFLTAIEKMEYDSLNLSSIDKDKDQKVTKEEYDLWTQEEAITKVCDEYKTKAASDFAGEDNDDIVKFLAALDEFKQGFVEQYRKDMKDVSEMADKFAQKLPEKYAEIKFDLLNNTKSAIKTRVVESVIEKINQESVESNSNVLGGKSTILSDNAKRLLGNILAKEADKFTKKYNGDNLENDLNTYLLEFLSKSDKEKLAEAIFIWDKDFEALSNLPAEQALKQMKDKAKNLVLAILENGVTVTMGCVTIRTEVGITPALAQYKDIDTLLYAIKDIIRKLSSVSKLEQMIREADGEENTPAVDLSYNLFGGADVKQNFFVAGKAA